jgi:hypothetical protein
MAKYRLPGLLHAGERIDACWSAAPRASGVALEVLAGDYISGVRRKARISVSGVQR